jgi:hypothetical protein
VLRADFLGPGADADDDSLQSDVVRGARATGTVRVHPRDAADCSPAADMDRFLDSLMLLFRNTAPGDALRGLVVREMLPHVSRLVRVRFFGVVVGAVQGLEEAIVGALAEDGFEVRVERGGEGAVRFAGEHGISRVLGLRR